MNENEFITEFLKELDLHMELCKIVQQQSLVYALSIDDNGEIHKRGFKQDILIQDNPRLDVPEVVRRAREVVPRVVAEVKFRRRPKDPGVTTHDVIAYSEKARLIRTVYPYLRYGLILGGFQGIPGRAVRLGQGFDFIFAISYPPFVPQQIDAARTALLEEVQKSRDLAVTAFGKQEITSFRRRVEHAPAAKVSGVSKRTMRLIVDLMSNGEAYSLDGLASKTGKSVATLQRQIYNLKKRRPAGAGGEHSEVAY